MGLYVVLDVTTNLEDFVGGGEKAGGLFSFVVHFYSYKAILFFDNTSGLLALVSAMFTVAWIQRHNEMTALMAAGVPRIRVLLPMIIAVAVVSLLSAVNRETLIPRYRRELARRPQDPLGDQPQSLVQRCDGKTDVLLKGKHTFADQQADRGARFRAAGGLAGTAGNWRRRTPIGGRPKGAGPPVICSWGCGNRKTSTAGHRCCWAVGRC